MYNVEVVLSTNLKTFCLPICRQQFIRKSSLYIIVLKQFETSRTAINDKRLRSLVCVKILTCQGGTRRRNRRYISTCSKYITNKRV